MATKIPASDLCRRTAQYIAGPDFPAHSSIRQKKGRLDMRDGRPQVAAQEHLLRMIQRAKMTGMTSSGVIQARVPTCDALNALKGRLTPDTVREKLTVLMKDLWPDMAPLEVNVWVSAIVQSDGSIDQVYYNQCFCRTDAKEEKRLQYKDPKQADAAFTPADLVKFEIVLDAATGVVNDTKAIPDSINKVFGGKHSEAGSNYDKIGTKIEQIKQQVDIHVTTDYNGDDGEIGIGGYADFAEKKVHFMQEVIDNSAEDKTTVIHECAHLIDNSIEDKGYFGSPGFENMSEDDKLNNAAHYEVVPGWVLGITTYPKDMEFSYIPPAAMGIKEDGERQASEYFREAWDVAFNCAVSLRENVDKPLTAPEEVKLKGFSTAVNLSIHSQAGSCRITLLDVTLMERIVRNVCDLCEAVQEFSGDVTLVSNADEIKEKLITEALGRSTAGDMDRTVLDYLRTNPLS